MPLGAKPALDTMKTNRSRLALFTTLLALAMPFVAFTACGEGSDDSSGDEPSAGGGAGGQAPQGSGGETAGDGDQGTGGELGHPEPDCPTSVNLGVRIVGRHSGCPEGATQTAWSGTGFVARFEGTGLSFSQSGSGVEYTVVVDGEVRDKLVTMAGQHTYEVVSGLDDGEHIVEVYRRSEASFGTTNLWSVEAIGGELLDPPPRPERFIEIFGDSITCGYGNEGEDTSCSFSIDTENHYMTYGAILARGFEAELSTVAWSGKGVVSNYGGDMGTTLPEMVDRVLPAAPSSSWDYSLLGEADLVIINLGTNDFSTDNDPTPEDFEAGYLSLLETLRARYPGAFILCTLGPLLTGSDLATAAGAIEGAIAQMDDDEIAYHAMQTGNPSPGCDWHPSITTHEAMAAELSAVVTDELGW